MTEKSDEPDEVPNAICEARGEEIAEEEKRSENKRKAGAFIGNILGFLGGVKRGKMLTKRAAYLYTLLTCFLVGQASHLTDADMADVM